LSLNDKQIVSLKILFVDTRIEKLHFDKLSAPIAKS
jgi:hypothetical protein